MQRYLSNSYIRIELSINQSKQLILNNSNYNSIMNTKASVNTPSAASKRNRSSPLDRDHSKKHKENQANDNNDSNDDDDDDGTEDSMEANEVINKLAPIMFIGVDKEYANNPTKIKNDLDANYPNVKIKSTRITMKGNLIVEFDNLDELRRFASAGSKIKCEKSIILEDRKEIHEIVIKGIKYKVAANYIEEIKKQGIIGISEFNKRKEDYNMIKAVCIDANTVNRLLNTGIKIEYCNYKAEKYIKQIRPVQCYKCQKFGHISNKCLETESTCVRCGDKHKLSECKAEANLQKCSNCHGNHTSSFAGCSVYQKHLKEKLEKIQNKPSNIQAMRYYSEVAQKNNKLNETTLADLKSTVDKMTNEIASLREMYKELLEVKLGNQVQILDDEIKKVHKECQESVFRLPFIFLDLIHALFPNIKINQNQCDAIFESLSRHKMQIINRKEFQVYIDKLFKS